MRRLPSSPAFSPTSIHRAAPVERLALIRSGVPARALTKTAADLGLTSTRICMSLGISSRTLNRRLAEGGLLSTADSDRVVGLLKLIGQVEAMVNESGDPTDFDACRWFGDWLESPCPALDGTKPVEWLDTFEGQALIANLLVQMQSGAYA